MPRMTRESNTLAPMILTTRTESTLKFAVFLGMTVSEASTTRSVSSSSWPYCLAAMVGRTALYSWSRFSGSVTASIDSSIINQDRQYLDLFFFFSLLLLTLEDLIGTTTGNL